MRDAILMLSLMLNALFINILDAWLALFWALIPATIFAGCIAIVIIVQAIGDRHKTA